MRRKILATIPVTEQPLMAVESTKLDSQAIRGENGLIVLLETGNVCVILEIDGWEVICDDVITT